MLILNLTTVNLFRGLQTECLYNGKLTFQQESSLNCAEELPLEKVRRREPQAPAPPTLISSEFSTKLVQPLPAGKPIGALIS